MAQLTPEQARRLTKKGVPIAPTEDPGFMESPKPGLKFQHQYASGPEGSYADLGGLVGNKAQARAATKTRKANVPLKGRRPNPRGGY